MWLRTAPHLVYPLTMLLPTYRGRSRSEGKPLLHLGLTIYDLLAFDRGWLPDPDQRLPGHSTMTVAELLALQPDLPTADLTGALRYYDCQMFSPERLALECLLSAAAAGAELCNYTIADGPPARRLARRRRARARPARRRGGRAARPPRHQRRRPLGGPPVADLPDAAAAGPLEGRAHHHPRPHPRARPPHRRQARPLLHPPVARPHPDRHHRRGLRRRPRRLPRHRGRHRGLLATVNASPALGAAHPRGRAALLRRPAPAGRRRRQHLQRQPPLEVHDHARGRPRGPDLGDRRQVDHLAPPRRAGRRARRHQARPPPPALHHRHHPAARRRDRQLSQVRRRPRSNATPATTPRSSSTSPATTARAWRAAADPRGRPQPRPPARRRPARDRRPGRPRGAGEMAVALTDVVLRRTGLGTLGNPGETALGAAPA
jgi:hypothetical protein